MSAAEYVIVAYGAGELRGGGDFANGLCLDT